MARPTTEPLTVEQAKAQLREVATQFAVPQVVVALLAGVVVGCSPSIRHALFSGSRWLLRRMI